MQLTHLIRHASRVIPVTSSTPNRHTHTTIRVAHACNDQGTPIATRITMNTVSAKTRHTAARRMIADPALSLPDVQWLLGHALITTTQIYTEPSADEVVQRVRAHHHAAQAEPRPPAAPAPGYRPEVLATLLGTSR